MKSGASYQVHIYNNNSQFDLTETECDDEFTKMNYMKLSKNHNISNYNNNNHNKSQDIISLGDPLPLPYDVKPLKPKNAISSNFDPQAKIRRRNKITTTIPTIVVPEHSADNDHKQALHVKNRAYIGNYLDKHKERSKNAPRKPSNSPNPIRTNTSKSSIGSPANHRFDIYEHEFKHLRHNENETNRNSVGSSTVVDSEAFKKDDLTYQMHFHNQGSRLPKYNIKEESDENEFYKRNKNIFNSVNLAKQKLDKLNSNTKPSGLESNEASVINPSNEKEEITDHLINDFKSELATIATLFNHTSSLLKKRRDGKEISHLKSQLNELRETFENVCNNFNSLEKDFQSGSQEIKQSIPLPTNTKKGNAIGQHIKKEFETNSQQSFLVEKNEPTTDDELSDMPKSDTSLEDRISRDMLTLNKSIDKERNTHHKGNSRNDFKEFKKEMTEGLNININDLKSPPPEKFGGFIQNLPSSHPSTDDELFGEASMRYFKFKVAIFLLIILFLLFSYIVSDKSSNYCYFYCF